MLLLVGLLVNPISLKLAGPVHHFIVCICLDSLINCHFVFDFNRNVHIVHSLCVHDRVTFTNGYYKCIKA